MILKYTISPSGFTEDFIVRVWESADKFTPGAFIYETTLVEKNGGGVPTPGAGHQVIETITVNGVDKFVHTIRLIGAVSGFVYHDFDGPPETDNISVFAPIRFKIGDGGPNTPAAFSAIYTNPLLVGLTESQYVVTRNNYGAIFPTIHYVLDPPSGSFTLTSPDQWSEADEVTIQIAPQKITTPVNDSVVGKWFGATEARPDMFVDITSDISYDATHLRKLLRFNGAFTYSFDFNPPTGYGFVFNNLGNPEVTGHIAFNNAPLKWGATVVSSIDMESFSEAAFVFDGTNWNLIYKSNTTPIGITGVVGSGLYNVGDVISSGDLDYEISHNLGITGDYIVLFSLKSNTGASKAFDNDVIGCWYHHSTNKPNRFIVNLQEKAAGLQNLSIAWTIIKL